MDETDPDDVYAPAIGMSHMKIWRHMVDSGIALAIVLEDDALGAVAPAFCELMQRAVRAADGYELLRLDYWANGLEPPAPGAGPSAAEYRMDARAPGHGQGCEVQWGTAMYAVTLDGARKSLEGYRPDWFPVDWYGSPPTRNSALERTRLAC